jgi:transcription elongation factor SPT6
MSALKRKAIEDLEEDVEDAETNKKQRPASANEQSNAEKSIEHAESEDDVLEDEEDEEEDEEVVKPSKKKSAAHKYIDLEVEVSDEEDVQVSSDEEENDEEARKVIAGFIVDEAEEEEDDFQQDDEEAYNIDELDEDDMELVASNLGLKIKGKDDQEGRKRILKRKDKKIVKPRDEDLSDESDELSEEPSAADVDVEEYDKPVSGAEPVPIKRVGIRAPSEAIEIFGDMTDFLQQEAVSFREMVGAGDASSDESFSKMDPSLAAYMFVTKEDEKIRETDIPERLQTRVQFRESLPESSISEEVDWIISQAYSNRMLELSESQRTKFQESISNVLGFIRNEHLEVPFVYSYKKEYYSPHLAIPDLWLIDEYDERWDQYHSRRCKLKSALMVFPGESRSLINLASDEFDIDDVNLYLQYKMFQYFDKKAKSGHGEIENVVFKKLSGRRALNQWGYAKALDGFVDQILGDMRAYSENLSAKVVVSPVTSPNFSPESYSTQFINERFQSNADVLETAVKYAAWKFSMEPSVRCRVRRDFMKKAVVSTSMTSLGASQIEFGHEYFTVRSLFQKPLLYFEGSQFILIMKAVKENLLTCHISLDSQSLNLTVEKYLKYFEGDSNPWNSSWMEIVNYLFYSCLSNMVYLAQKCHKNCI